MSYLLKLGIGKSVDIPLAHLQANIRFTFTMYVGLLAFSLSNIFVWARVYLNITANITRRMSWEIRELSVIYGKGLKRCFLRVFGRIDDSILEGLKPMKAYCTLKDSAGS